MDLREFRKSNPGDRDFFLKKREQFTLNVVIIPMPDRILQPAKLELAKVVNLLGH